MYTQYFGFQKPPFKMAPDSGFFYTNAVFLAAHCSLLDAIDDQLGLSLLTGEPGTGKTTLLNRLAQDLDDTVRFVYLQNSNLTPQDFISSLFDRFDLTEEGKPREPIDSGIEHLRNHFRRLNEQRFSCVLFVDDAQNLPRDTLALLPRLIEADGGNCLLQVVLCGTPELLRKLADPEITEVSASTASHAELDPLPASEIAFFIDHQVRMAGSMRSDLFSEGAIREIAQATTRRPGDVNRVCDKALEIAYRQGTQVITREIVRQTSSPAWLDIEPPMAGVELPPAPVKQPATALFRGLSGGDGKTGPFDRIGIWLSTRAGRAVTRVHRSIGARRQPLVEWTGRVVERLGITLIIAAAKTWKYGVLAWGFVKAVPAALKPTISSLSRFRAPKLNRRHAWIGGGLVLATAFLALFAIPPLPEKRPQPSGREVADTMTASNEKAVVSRASSSAEGSSSKAVLSKEREPQTSGSNENTAGRQLSTIAELRASVAQLNLDLKITAANRDYLKNQLEKMTVERDSLSIELDRVKFAQKQQQVTLEATRGQLAELEQALAVARTSVPAGIQPPVAPDGEAGPATFAATNASAEAAKENSFADRPAIELASVPQTTASDAAETDPSTTITAAAPAGPNDTSAASVQKEAQARNPEPAGDDETIAGIAGANGSLDNAILTEADSVADRPASPGSQAPLAAATPSNSPPPASGRENVGATEPQPDPNHKAITRLLRKADHLYDRDLLTTPAGNNAYQIYNRILAVVPEHPEATAGIERIAARYRSWAESEQKAGNTQGALRYYEKALSVTPDDPELTDRIAGIEGRRSSDGKKPQTASAETRKTDTRESESARGRLKTLGIETSERSLLRAVEAGNLEIADLLIDAGISPDARNVSKQTALLTSAINGDISMVSLLLERGADVNKTNNLGRSPLIAAAWNGHTSLVDLLLKGGADIEATSEEGWNALMYAAWNGHGSTVSSLLEHGCKVDAVNSQGWTALMNAAWNGHNETVRVLLEHGANAGYETARGETAQMVASQQGHRETALLLD